MVKNRNRIDVKIAFLLFIGLSFPFSAFAETIVLKSGKKVEGKIIEKTDKYIKVDFDGVPLTYFFDMIERIEGEQKPVPKNTSTDGTKLQSFNEQAVVMSNNGLMLIKEGKWDEGLALMKQAKDIEARDGSLHMNYAGMLFMKGQKLHEMGNKEETKPIFNEVEKELYLAIPLFKDDEGGNILKSQCSFLLGDVYFYVYNDREKAKDFYQRALEYYPEHGGALNALKTINDNANKQGAETDDKAVN